MADLFSEEFEPICRCYPEQRTRVAPWTGRSGRLHHILQPQPHNTQLKTLGVRMDQRKIDALTGYRKVRPSLLRQAQSS